jgi:hypothetical protein
MADVAQLGVAGVRVVTGGGSVFDFRYLFLSVMPSPVSVLLPGKVSVLEVTTHLLALLSNG